MPRRCPIQRQPASPMHHPPIPAPYDSSPTHDTAMPHTPPSSQALIPLSSFLSPFPFATNTNIHPPPIFLHSLPLCYVPTRVLSLHPSHFLHRQKRHPPTLHPHLQHCRPHHHYKPCSTLIHCSLASLLMQQLHQRVVFHLVELFGKRISLPPLIVCTSICSVH